MLEWLLRFILAGAFLYAGYLKAGDPIQFLFDIRSFQLLPDPYAALVAMGLLQLGTFIKYIPFPVTVGFTAGVAVIIFASQLRELLGITLEHEPGELVPKVKALWAVKWLTPSASQLLAAHAATPSSIHCPRWAI